MHLRKLSRSKVKAAMQNQEQAKENAEEKTPEE